ncbi:hypothetical protein [Nocardia cyriacigeorgica]|uniref:Uncharacterized protein n=1 Tax=Nocardia cyriacigeorgica TaxID=135487 RepID=A0A6P1DC35_9NOCA|nr:hypothetical protein [Nocardia cyriacigeorgica]NEW48335.1 hypothetical protein [Nocardia cyriacigeorgica]
MGVGESVLPVGWEEASSSPSSSADELLGGAGGSFGGGGLLPPVLLELFSPLPSAWPCPDGDGAWLLPLPELLPSLWFPPELVPPPFSAG